jgi:hypothetical protein
MEALDRPQTVHRPSAELPHTGVTAPVDRPPSGRTVGATARRRPGDGPATGREGAAQVPYGAPPSFPKGRSRPGTGVVREPPRPPGRPRAGAPMRPPNRMRGPWRTRPGRPGDASEDFRVPGDGPSMGPRRPDNPAPPGRPRAGRGVSARSRWPSTGSTAGRRGRGHGSRLTAPGSRRGSGAARIAGVPAATIRAYRSRRRMPLPATPVSSRW